MSSPTTALAALVRPARELSALRAPAGLPGRTATLWGGRTGAVVGSELTTVALPLAAVLLVGASAIEVGWLAGAGTAAALVATVAVGAGIRRTASVSGVIVADLLRLLVALGIGILGAAEELEIGWLIAAGAALGALTAVVEHGYAALLPAAARAAAVDVDEANRLEAGEALAPAAGVVIGGIIADVGRASTGLFVSAAGFLLSVLTLSRARTLIAGAAVERVEGEQAPGAALREGVDANFGNRHLRPLTLTALVANVGAQMILSLFVLYALVELELSPLWIGVIFAAAALGAVVGGLASGRLGTRSEGLGVRVVAAMGLYELGLAVTAFVDGSEALVVVLLIIAWFVAGAGLIVANTAQVGLREAALPGAAAERAIAAHRVIVFALVPVAAVVAGYLADGIGLRETLYVAAGVLGLAFLIAVASPLTGLRSTADVAPRG